MSDVCKCQSPKPRPAGVGRVVCVNSGCHREVKAKKKDGEVAAGYDNISDEEKRFAEWQVKTLMRLAHEIRVRYGLPMPE